MFILWLCCLGVFWVCFVGVGGCFGLTLVWLLLILFFLLGIITLCWLVVCLVIVLCLMFVMWVGFGVGVVELGLLLCLDVMLVFVLLGTFVF